MLFDTPVYFFFLIPVVLVYWRLNWRKQNTLLLVASYFFYGWWDWRFLFLILASTLVDFYVSQAIAASSDPARRKALLIFSLVLNFTFLGFFKYFDFFLDSAATTLDLLGFHHIPRSLLQIILPPGISFYTFQEVAYIVDVYYRKIKAADSLVDYALFISLFPHLIAGPIQRPSHLLPQVQKPRAFDPHKFFDGCMLILSGLFRKCVIADNCALLANAYFENRTSTDFVGTLIGIYAFAWQVYGDFSGYSDIARGSAQLMGFHFMVNFRQPYLATSLQDFWRRWHISLSTWLRDYLYIPLGGSHKGEQRAYVNLMITMLLGGLWHGAAWKYLVWGGVHGVWLSFERWMQAIKVRFYTEEPKGISIWVHRVVMFNIFCLALLIFRSRSLVDSYSLLRNLGHFAWLPEYGPALLYLAFFSGIMLLIDLQQEKTESEYLGERTSESRRVAMAMALITMIALFGAGQSNAFIYFQF